MICDICGRYPHNSRCPNYETHVYGECANCGFEILKDEEYDTDDARMLFCSDECAMQYHGIRKVIPYEEDYE